MTARAISRPGTWVLVALCRRQLRSQFWARLGWAGAVVALLVTWLVAAFAQESQATALGLSRTIDVGVRWMFWIGVGPLALAAADSPVERDRLDGVEQLVCVRGGNRIALMRARVIAAMIEASLRLVVPVALAAFLIAAIAASGSVALHGLRLLLFCVVTGSLLGALAALSGLRFGRRGRLMLAAIVLLPLFVTELWSLGDWSLPGAIDSGLYMLSLGDSGQLGALA